MDLRRFWRHVVTTPWSSARCFPSSTLDAIQASVAAGESGHRGELRFVVEAELTSAQLWNDMTSRERAIEVFSMARVWDTDENTGVLVYVLLADRKVEIVADRGIQARVSAQEWQDICRAMESAFHEGRFEAGATAGVSAISSLLTRHFPSRGANPNELPDRPLML
jgi:uncharacterized membrane protein